MTTSVRITTEYITLTQLLKEENIISSGGQAKYYLMDFPVLLNGETENPVSYTHLTLPTN